MTNKTKPESVARLLKRGIEHHSNGELQSAERCYLDALSAVPEHPRTLYLLGTLKAQTGSTHEAIPYLAASTRHDPGFIGAWVNLGNAQLQTGNAKDAEASFRRACDRHTTTPDACLGLGRTLLALRRALEAQQWLERAITMNPGLAEAHYQLGQSLFQQKSLERAAECYRAALGHNPKLLQAYNALGNALRTLGRLDDACDVYRSLLNIKPDAADAWNNLGNVLRQDAKLDDAADCYRKALSINPNQAESHNNLGNILKAQCLISEAINHYRESIRLNPSLRQTWSNFLLCLNYVPGLDNSLLSKEHKRWGQRSSKPAKEIIRYLCKPSTERRLRIGYMSPDFRTHAVAHFLEPLLAAHDRDVVEVICYAQLLKPDETTERFQHMTDDWHTTTHLSDRELAERIHNDQIDILVDLAGHTGRNRLTALAYRPAPIQVSWLGYPNTTGMSCIDYRFTDVISDPQGTDTHYTETLIRLDTGVTRYQPPDNSPDVEELPASTSGLITFGSLNNLVKLNSAVIALWSRVLSSIPGSRLLLYRDMLHGSVADRIAAEFRSHGIDPDRLDLRHEIPARTNYLSLYNEIDIGLDPFPWNGHVTTCEALWMGVPVVTLLGTAHRGRLSASVLHQVGLQNLVAGSAGAFVNIAAQLAGDHSSLASLRRQLRQQVADSRLCDGNSQAREIEAAYRQMWANWCSHQSH